MPETVQRGLIAGYYGFGNAGDELILRALISRLRRDEPGAELSVLSNDPERTAKQESVRAVNRWSPAAVWSELRRSDFLIFGGGGLLQDQTGSPGLWYYLSLLGMARWANVPVRIQQIGVGPLRSALNRRLACAAVRGAQRVSVRDEASARALSEWGIPRVEIAQDPVLQLQLPSASLSGGNGLGWILRRGPGSEEFWIDFNARAIRECVKRLQTEVQLTVFHPQLDARFAREVMNRLKATKADAVRMFEWTELDALIAWIAGRSAVVTYRYHAAVLAAMCGVPAVGIAIDPKISQFMDELRAGTGLPQNVIQCERIRPEEPASAVEQNLARAGEIRAAFRAGIERLRNRNGIFTA